MLDSEKTKEQLIAELVLAREKLRYLSESAKDINLLAFIVEGSDDAIISKNLEGVITSWNRGAEKIYQYFAKEAVGFSISMLAPPDRIDEIPNILSRIRSGERVDHFETVRRKKDGSIVNVSLTISPVMDNNFNVIGASTIARDITERKRVEELRADIERIIQHDLRSPACSAVIVAKLIADSQDISDSDRDLLIKLGHSGQRMLDTLNQSLDIYKINTEQYEVVPSEFDVVALVQEISDSLLLLPSLREKKVEIILNESSHQSGIYACSIVADVHLLRLALQNIIQNALEAVGSTKTIYINISSSEKYRIKIRNMGVVPVDIRDRFFGKYVTFGKKFGTGIGTYSAKMMIEAQNGTIEMETSDEKNETVVMITLPVRHLTDGNID